MVQRMIELLERSQTDFNSGREMRFVGGDVVPVLKGETMYRSPIEILTTDIRTQIDKGLEEEVFKAVVSVGINVDKAELLRALQYDRSQYQKGYFDGVEAATPRWIPVTVGLPEQTSRCLVVRWDYVTDKPFIDILWFEKSVWWNRLHSGNYAVTHWMPLPEPPKGGSL